MSFLSHREHFIFTTRPSRADSMPYITRLPAMLLNYIISDKFYSEVNQGGRHFASNDFYLNSVEFSITENPSRRFRYQALSLSLFLLIKYNNHTAARAREISLANIYYAPDLPSAVDDYHSPLFADRFKETTRLFPSRAIETFDGIQTDRYIVYVSHH